MSVPVVIPNLDVNVHRSYVPALLYEGFEQDSKFFGFVLNSPGISRDSVVLGYTEDT